MFDPDTIEPVPVFENVTFEQFRDDIYPAGKPAVLKGFVADWPIVQAGRKSADSVRAYIERFDSQKTVPVMYGPPDIDGKFFYSDDIKGVNFRQEPATISRAVSQMLSEDDGTVYVQSSVIPEFLPGFERENALNIVHPSVQPRIWIGNHLTVQTHFDLSDNLACVVAGRRRFTLFPPAQIKNLYIGPFEKTLAGPPVSMVRLNDVDTDRFPNFAEALKEAVIADLAPGDVLFVPYFWWHHVESLEPFNVLVNYWWNDLDPDLGSPFDALLHALLSFRGMPARHKKIWNDVFSHLVFEENGDPAAHLPKDVQGALGQHTPALRKHMRQNLVRALAYQAGIVPRGQ